MSLSKTQRISPTCSDQSHPNCFVCGPQNPIGLGLNFIPMGPTKVQALFVTRPIYQGYADRLHGGIISTLLDAAMTHCLFHQNIEAVTAELKVKFRKPVALNQQVRLEAELVSQRRGVYFLEACLYHADHSLAGAKGKFVRLQ